MMLVGYHRAPPTPCYVANDSSAQPCVLPKHIATWGTYAVGLAQVVHGSALGKELGVRQDLELDIGVLAVALQHLEGGSRRTLGTSQYGLSQASTGRQRRRQFSLGAGRTG